MKKRIAIITTIVFLLDQISKYLIDSFLNAGESIKIFSFFKLSRLSNTGAAFSILENKTILLLIVSIMLFIYILRESLKSKRLFSDIYYSLIMGGILGNFLDRVAFKGVRDFIDIKVFSYNFPVFNIADMAIVIGAILYIISLVGEKDEVNR